MQITPEILEALNFIKSEVDGLVQLDVVPATNGMQPVGKRQECDHEPLGAFEWVEQRGHDDSFYGTIT